MSGREVSAMSIDQLQQAVVPLFAHRARQEVARKDYLRGLRALALEATQVDLARALGVSQPAVSQALGDEARLAPVPAGFHGGDPEEIIQRFAAGELDRDQVIDELARWDYAPSDELDGPLDDILVEVPGSFDVVVRAARTGILPADVYDAILDRYDEQIDTTS